jgi:hypothetical protein
MRLLLLRNSPSNNNKQPQSYDIGQPNIFPATNICFLSLHTITDYSTSPYRGPRVKKTLEISWTAPYNRTTHTSQVMWCPQPENVDSPRWLRRWYADRKPSQQFFLEVFAQLRCYT